MTTLRQLDLLVLYILTTHIVDGKPPSQRRLIAEGLINEFIDGYELTIPKLHSVKTLISSVTRLRDAKLIMPIGRYVPTAAGNRLVMSLPSEGKHWPLRLDVTDGQWDPAAVTINRPPRYRNIPDSLFD